MNPKTILFFQSSFSAVCRRSAVGVQRFAAEVGWRLHVIHYANAAEKEDDRFGNVLNPASLAALLDKQRPDGCIVVWSPSWPNLAQSMGDVPCVLIDKPGVSASVRFDNAAIGRAAAAELLRLNLASMAFLPLHRTAYWSKERTVAFARAVRERGFKAVDLGDAGESVNVVSDRLVAALRALPKPCGLFAVNDLVARRALDAAESAGLSVPYDLAVVGVDDDESVCEGAGTTITSVRPDFERMGSAACEWLETILERRGDPGGRCIRIGDPVVVRRASSRRLLRRDPLVEEVLEDIRLRYAEGFSVAALAKERNVFLRTLERRFLRAKGRTIGRELADTRLLAARRLLSEPAPRGIEAVANLCGYDSASTLRKAFRARFGMSPCAFRNAARKSR